MKKILNQFGTALSALLVAVLFALCVAFVYMRLAGLSPFVVTGASMEPNISKGSLVFVEPVKPSQVRLGDVITFFHYDQVTTHRVIEIASTAAGLTFRTKGDANEAADPDPMVFPGQVGVARGSVPAVGFLLSYVQYYWRTALTLMTAVVFFGCAAMLIFRRDVPKATVRQTAPVPAAPPVAVRGRSIDTDELWNAHIQWVRQATAQRIRAA